MDAAALPAFFAVVAAAATVSADTIPLSASTAIISGLRVDGVGVAAVTLPLWTATGEEMGERGPPAYTGTRLGQEPVLARVPSAPPSAMPLM